MTHSKAVLSRFEILTSAAVIAAHANSEAGQFRQKDVKFLLDLFSNWIEHSTGESSLLVQNTQILRYLEQLHKEGFCRRMAKRPPLYVLERVGIIVLLQRLSELSRRTTPDLCFFACYFIHNYKDRLWKLVEKEGQQFPLALRIELESLLDYEQLLHRAILELEREIRKLESRIHSAQQTSLIAEKHIRKGEDFNSLLSLIERDHPYELSSQKPLSELINSLPKDHGMWELTVGGKRRADELWSPSLQILKSFHSALLKLRGQMA